MKYFYDTEFIDDGKTIDLISIGVVSEDGSRQLYLESSEFNAANASDWVKENVISKLTSTPALLARTREQIKNEIIQFFEGEEKIELWGYYADYDHVALCQLFGTMMELPKNMPMYTMDIKQLCNSLGNPSLPVQGKGEHNALADAKWNLETYKFLIDSPNKTNK